MSTNLALSMPVRAPRERTGPEQAPRHIEVISTRSQRRARPKIVYAVVAVVGLFLILIAQLLLSIVLSGGAYKIAALQASQKELSRDQQTLTESIHVLSSPQNLATQANALGMVVNSSDSGWLDISSSNSTVLKTPSAAASASSVSTTGGGLIGNYLITPELLASQAATAAALKAATATTTTTAPAASAGSTAVSGTATSAGAPAGSAAAGSVASTPSVIPSPVTH